MTRRQSREDKLTDLASERGWQLVKVGRRFRLVDATTATVVADNWTDSSGLTLDDIEQALAR
jgi:hypothetical protein